jgi:serine/threonine protein kinase
MHSFDFPEGKVLAKKYEVLQCLGSGYEGEVYLVREVGTDIERAVKFFNPKQNARNKTLTYYAKKLHKLRHCSILIQYCTQDSLEIDDVTVPFLVSEYVDGELLADFLSYQPGKRLHPFQALHLLYELVKGLEEIHTHGEYHGDIHTENIIVQRYGLGFELKLIDMFRWSTYSNPENRQDDIVDAITVFYELIGGKQHYARQDDTVKYIVSGLKRSSILRKFRTISKLREHLESLEWK